MDNTEESPAVLSFCTGYGGIEIGLARAIGEINVLAHVEIEAYAIANLVAKMEAGDMVPAPVWTDIKTFNPWSFRKCVDILCGGYPCQPFSTAGQRKGSDDPRHLWPWIKKHIMVIKPGLCFFENVEGHISLGLREVLTDLVGLGYRVENDNGEPTWGLFSAAECGAPHQRKRVFILAILDDSGSAELNRIPEPEERREDRAVGVTSFGLADADKHGLQGRCQLGEPKTGRETAQFVRYDFTGHHPQRWPTRPGEPQREWEEPKVLLERKAKSELGGTIDGSSNRMDRLRLLGNGVVPATAEKAFRTLYGRILK